MDENEEQEQAQGGEEEEKGKREWRADNADRRRVKRKRRVFLTSVLGGARNAILMKNAESTRIPAHSY